MGFFGKSIEEKILDMALLAIDEDKPVKDKFLIFYRVCQFDLSFSFKNDEEEKLLTKYKNEPIYPKQYKGVKSHLKAIYVVMMEISFFIAKRDKIISESDYLYIWNGINDELKEKDPEAQKLIKVYKGISDESGPMIPYDISKKYFNNKLEESIYSIRDWVYLARDAFRAQTEEILGQGLVWAYREPL
jgi:hypothetical protein